MDRSPQVIAQVGQSAGTPAPASGLEIDVHSSVDAIAPEWERLATRTLASPFLRAGWIKAWWRAFGEGDLKVYAARRDGELCGVLPVVVQGPVVTSPANWHTPEFGPVATGGDVTRALLERGASLNPRRFELTFVDEGNPALAEFAKLTNRRSTARRVLLHSPLVPIEGTWVDYEAGLSKNLRSSVRRTRRRLSEQGELTFEITDGHERFEELLHDGMRLEAAGWKGQRGTAMISRPDTRQFYLELADWARVKGILRLAVLRLEGRMIAFEFSLQDHRRYYMLKPAFDPALSKFGPGKLLTYETVRQSFRDGLESNEFLGSDEPYKMMWTQARRDRVAVQLFSRSPAGHIDRIVQTWGRDAARRVRSLRPHSGNAGG